MVKERDSVRLLVERPNDAYPEGGVEEDWRGNEVIIPRVFPVGTICEVECALEDGTCSTVVHYKADPLELTLGSTPLVKGQYELVKK